MFLFCVIFHYWQVKFKIALCYCALSENRAALLEVVLKLFISYILVCLISQLVRQVEIHRFVTSINFR